MKILLTGARGQIAAALAGRLRPKATVVVTDRTSLDLSRPEAIPGAFDRVAPDLVINAAAFTEVDRAEAEPALARVVNANAPGIMALWAAKRDVPLIHFSTDYVFSAGGKRPLTEEDLPAPLSVYGATKLEGERQILSRGGPSLIIRTSWIYSAHGQNFLRRIAGLAKINEELRVVDDQIGAPTSAALVADAVTEMLAVGLQEFVVRAQQSGRIVHLAARGETSWHGFASEIVEGLRARGLPLAVKRIIAINTCAFPARARRPSNSRLDLTKLQTIFGITTPYWRDALKPELDNLAEDFS